MALNAEHERVVKEHASTILARLDNHGPERRLLVGISGVPGSGKSWFAQFLAEEIDKTRPNITKIVGMDGWHLTREHLRQSQDPEMMFARRGAEFTFDAAGFAEFVDTLHQPINPDVTLLAPSFDHAVKDPCPDAVRIEPNHRIVLIEGLYCNANTGQWAKAASMMDVRYNIEVDGQVAIQRLAQRHLNAGITQTYEEGLQRASGSDMINGQWVLAHLLQPCTSIAFP
ncbi:P-loop containing nucleoside triphosphate hydrolase protein [Testicularia cyperi]|uniref:P-loop containing nucleoside triphosphate hydrolase protein n=1 Tax=Testicularia cyperi TaxID=1882483 RepID=A0A317XSQ4_9BASI|nr:P-loop containing nucleoside triphosphate hydrolase protein [Testicularia cyperi]